MGLLTYTPLNDGTGIDASDVNAPFNTIYNEFNGNISDTNIANASVSPAKLTASGNLEQYRQDACADFVVSGLGVTQSAGLIGAVASGVVYIGGIRRTPIGNPSITFTASKDTYIDLDSGGNLVYTGGNVVANGAAAPALATGHFRLAKVVTSGVAITSIVTTGFDSLGNIYSNKNPFGYTKVFFPTFQNSWVEYDVASFGVTHYAKTKTGIVTLNGLIRSGATAVIFTLPAGFRPAQNGIYDTLSNNAIARVDINSDGVVSLSAGSNAYLTLSGISFYAAG